MFLSAWPDCSKGIAGTKTIKNRTPSRRWGDAPRDQISAISQKSHKGIFEIPDPVRYRYRIPILYWGARLRTGDLTDQTRNPNRPFPLEEDQKSYNSKVKWHNRKPYPISLSLSLSLFSKINIKINVYVYIYIYIYICTVSDTDTELNLGFRGYPYVILRISMKSGHVPNCVHLNED